MKTAEATKPIVSRPTMCLGCHLVVGMQKGEKAWICPRCGHAYLFRFWKIKAGGKGC